jgi:hypothetical protein
MNLKMIIDFNGLFMVKLKDFEIRGWPQNFTRSQAKSQEKRGER